VAGLSRRRWIRRAAGVNKDSMKTCKLESYAATPTYEM